MKYQIKIGHKKDMWFVTVAELIVKVFYSVKAAQTYIESNSKGKDND